MPWCKRSWLTLMLATVAVAAAIRGSSQVVDQKAADMPPLLPWTTDRGYYYQLDGHSADRQRVKKQHSQSASVSSSLALLCRGSVHSPPLQLDPVCRRHHHHLSRRCWQCCILPLRCASREQYACVVARLRRRSPRVPMNECHPAAKEVSVKNIHCDGQA